MTPDRAADIVRRAATTVTPDTNGGRTSLSGAGRMAFAGGRRAVRYIWVGAVLGVLAWALVGCAGSGPPSFSGGGVPIGGSRLFGRVVAAAKPSVSVGNVALQVQATPDGGTPVNLQTTTGPDGTFNVSNVMPGSASGTVQITATATEPGYETQRFAFSLASGHTAQAIVTLPPASFDPTSAKTIALAIASPAVPTGGSVQIQAVVRDAAGQPLGVMPSLVFDGIFGTLAQDGTLTVPKGILSGTGSISAYWFNLGAQSQPIHVDPNAGQQPPSPPVLPAGQVRDPSR